MPRGIPYKSPDKLNNNNENSMINATVTTGSLESVAEEPVTIKRKKTIDKKSLDNCGCCGKKLTLFVAADGLRFCNDDCLKEYFS